VSDRVTLWPFGPAGGELVAAGPVNATGFELTAKGEMGQTYHLQAATELPAANWTNVFSFKLTTPLTNYVDADALTMARRYYRLTVR